MLNTTLLRDLGERVIVTYCQALITLLLAGPFAEALGQGHVDLSALQSAGVAAIAAVLALLKGGLAALRRDTVSPASLVKPGRHEA